MTHFLVEKYPEGFVPIAEFGSSHPDLMPLRRAQHFITNLESQPLDVQRIFRKRFGRWFIHVPSLVAHLEDEASLPGVA